MNEGLYLDSVKKTLNLKIKEIDEKLTDNLKDIETMHNYFWDNYAEFDEYGYEVYDNSNALKNRMKEQGNRND